MQNRGAEDMSAPDEHTDSIDWRGAIRNLLAQLRVWFVLPPLALSALVAYLSYSGVYDPWKPTLESLALWLLAIGTALACVRLFLSRDVFFVWGAAVLLTLLCREIHFVGTSEGVYVSLVLLGLLAVRFHDRLEGYLAQPFVVNALAMGFFCYVITNTTDQRWWKARSSWPGIPGEEVFHVPLEETMEVVGHLFFIAAILLARRQSGPRSSAET
jgi:hypothetical protein